MKWQNHILIGGSLAAAVNPILIPVAVLGSTAPDWLEMLINPFYTIRHRTVTHYVVLWVALMAFFALGLDYRHFGLAFAIGGFSHVMADAFTVSGVPFGWWSSNRFHLFGGQLRTGRPGEYIVAFIITIICAYIALHTAPFPLDKTQAETSGFIPFFYDWAGYYGDGVVSGKEWKDNRMRFL